MTKKTCWYSMKIQHENKMCLVKRQNFSLYLKVSRDSAVWTAREKFIPEIHAETWGTKGEDELSVVSTAVV